MWEDFDLCTVLNKASTCVGLLPNVVDSTKFSRDKIFKGQNFQGTKFLWDWPFANFHKKKFRGSKILADQAHLRPLHAHANLIATQDWCWHRLKVESW